MKTTLISALIISTFALVACGGGASTVEVSAVVNSTSTSISPSEAQIVAASTIAKVDAAADETPAKVDGTTVQMYAELGTVQCDAGAHSESALKADLVAKLVNSGVAVKSSSCGHDGIAHIASCGYADGKIAVVSVSANNAAQAKALGFNSRLRFAIRGRH